MDKNQTFAASLLIVLISAVTAYGYEIGNERKTEDNKLVMELISSGVHPILAKCAIAETFSACSLYRDIMLAQNTLQ